MGKGHPPLGVAKPNWWRSSFGVVRHLQENCIVSLQVKGMLTIGLDLSLRRSTVDTNVEIKTAWLIKRGRNPTQNLSGSCGKR